MAAQRRERSSKGRADPGCSRRHSLELTPRRSFWAAGMLVRAGRQSSPPRPASLRAEVESPRLRVVQTPSMCQSPQYVAQDLLRGEGFTDLEYVKKTGPKWNGLAVASPQAANTTHVTRPPRPLQQDADTPW